MKIKFTIIAFILALTNFTTLSPAAACVPSDEDATNRLACVRFPPRAPAAALVVKNPQGTSPQDALSVPDAWQSMGPHGSVWYKIPYSENFRLLEFWLEMNLPNVAGFSIFSPEQIEGLSPATKPVGRGTHSQSDPENIIRWKASYAKPGVWYLYLYNRTDQPISFKMNSNQQSTPVKKCISYWEYLPTGEYVLWTDCGFYTGPKD